MKILKNNKHAVLIFLAITVLMLYLNIALGIYPVLSFLKFMESEKYYWTITLAFLFLCGFWLFDRYMRKKIVNERVEIFNATIRTVQDILQNSTSSLQLLILDMKDEGVSEEIIMNAEKNIDEFKKVVNALAAIDPKTIELKELNKSLSIIKMDK